MTLFLTVMVVFLTAIASYAIAKLEVQYELRELRHDIGELCDKLSRERGEDLGGK